MPNLVPPVTTKDALLSYKKRVIEACKGDDFTPYMKLLAINDLV
jgi:dihydroorotase